MSLLEEIARATKSPSQSPLEPIPSILLGDDDVSNALRTIDEANSSNINLQRTATAESEARYYVALFDYQVRS